MKKVTLPARTRGHRLRRRGLHQRCRVDGKTVTFTIHTDEEIGRGASWALSLAMTPEYGCMSRPSNGETADYDADGTRALAHGESTP